MEPDRSGSGWAAVQMSPDGFLATAVLPGEHDGLKNEFLN